MLGVALALAPAKWNASTQETCLNPDPSHRSGQTRYVEMSLAVVTGAATAVVGSVAIARAAKPPVR